MCFVSPGFLIPKSFAANACPVFPQSIPRKAIPCLKADYYVLRVSLTYGQMNIALVCSTLGYCMCVLVLVPAVKGLKEDTAP